MTSSQQSLSSLSPPMEQLLENDEVILLVDDYPDILILLQEFLKGYSFPTITAGSAAELWLALQGHKVALILLDIGLPDGDGIELLPDIAADYPDTAVIMLTAVTDLHTAMACMRKGADDYLTKPVQFTEVFETVRKVLEKRRLTINNRRYQRQIEQARFRIELLHELTLKMNTAYLGMVELDEILQAILVGITAEEGLQFNRAFLALFDETGENLQGCMAIGPACREEAGRIWREMQEKDLRFHKIIHSIKEKCLGEDTEVNRIVRGLRVPSAAREHILIRAAENRQSINVVQGKSDYPVPPELLSLLREDTFVVVPLFSPSRSLGVLIADHFVTRKPIDAERISALESFASQASLAIEHCHLYMAMERKITELEAVSLELEKNKDLLVAAERYSALGHMAAQLAHNIRNPITTIGGTARMLSRKIDDPKLLKFLSMMTSEAEKIETTLEDLFSFVATSAPKVREKASLTRLIDKSLILYYNSMQRKNIEHHLLLPPQDIVFDMDAKQIQQIFVHLIRNSIEAMPEGGVLTITVTLDQDAVIIAVRDTGIGIDSYNLPRATDPFFTTKTYGTGMGLTLVKRIVADHGGSFELKSVKDGGTEAIIRFPL